VKENNAYLEDHPEVKELLNDYISAALVEQPEDVFHFAREFFAGIATDDIPDKGDAGGGGKKGRGGGGGGYDDDDDEDAMGGGDDQDDLDDMMDDAGGAGNPELRAYLKQVFESMDTDDSGTISQAELSKKLAQDDELKQLLEAAGGSGDWYVLEQLDTDGDGEVTWQEFESMLGDRF